MVFKLMGFMNKFGLITARDPNNGYKPMTDVIHKVLNDITVDDRAVIVGGDSHTRMSKGVAFGADSGTVALIENEGNIRLKASRAAAASVSGSASRAVPRRS